MNNEKLLVEHVGFMTMSFCTVQRSIRVCKNWESSPVHLETASKSMSE